MHRWNVGDTRRHLVELLRVRGEQTIDELARSLHLTRSTVRTHLAFLAAEGIVARRGLRSGKRRPSIVYGLTAAAEALLPNAYAKFAAAVLGEVKLSGARDLDELLRRVGDRWVARDLPLVDGTIGQERLKRVQELLAAYGFMPALERTADGYLLREHHCPVMPLAVPHAEICDMVHRWLEALCGAPITRVQCMRKGDPYSVYLVSTGSTKHGVRAGQR